MSRGNRLSVRRMIGPWPIRPWAVSALSTALMFSLLSSVLAAVRSQPQYADAPLNQGAADSLPLAVLFFSVLSGTLVLLRFIQQRFKRAYALAFFGGIALVAFYPVTIRVLWRPEVAPAHWANPSSWVIGYVFSFILIWFFHAVLGSNELRLKQEIERTQKALALVEEQRGKLVETQEQVRSQISSYLHDNLQARLVVLGLQMRGFIDKLPASKQAVANSFIAELERIRAMDVRSAAQVLRPELEAVSLQSALAVLAENYRDAMRVDFKLDGVAASPWLPDQLKLAAYRIIEQALLNSATHGQAKAVTCSLEVGEGELHVRISNDGKPLPKEYKPGAGFAVIQSWVDVFGGSWAIERQRAETVLKATLRDGSLVDTPE